MTGIADELEVSRMPVRLILDAPGRAAWNMAVDEALMHSVLSHHDLPVLRIYTWNCRSLSIGRFQNVRRTLHWDQCEELNLPLVRRLSGGRAVAHGSDLTVSLCMRYSDLGFSAMESPSIKLLYCKINQWMIAALKTLGVSSLQGTIHCIPGNDKRGNCFDISTGSDLISAKTGQKLLGSAIHRSKVGFMYQASIPCSAPEFDLMDASISNFEFSKIFVQTEPNPAPPQLKINTVRDALIHSLTSEMKIDLFPSYLTSDEREAARELDRMKYSKADWTLNGIDSGIDS